MLRILRFMWILESASKLLELWTEFKYPQELKLRGRLPIGRHISIAIFDAPNEEALESMGIVEI